MPEPADPLAVPCAACLAAKGEPCYSVSSDEPRPAPHRLRSLAAAQHLKRCEACAAVGWVPDDEITVTITADTSGLESALKDARIATLELAVTALTQRAEQAERAARIHRDERDEAHERAQQTERALAQARDAIADERRGRLAAEAAVRRARELARNRIAVPTDVLLDALTAEQPKETR